MPWSNSLTESMWRSPKPARNSLRQPGYPDRRPVSYRYVEITHNRKARTLSSLLNLTSPMDASDMAADGEIYRWHRCVPGTCSDRDLQELRTLLAGYTEAEIRRRLNIPNLGVYSPCPFLDPTERLISCGHRAPASSSDNPCRWLFCVRRPRCGYVQAPTLRDPSVQRCPGELPVAKSR